MSQPQLLATDLVIGESARWHDGCLWLSNWGAQEILAYDLEGICEVMTRVPTTIPRRRTKLGDGNRYDVLGG
jgi:hypothetical protein